MNGYYITRNNPTVKISVEPQDEIDLSQMDIIELVLPECETVWCYHNYLTELIVPRGCKYIECQSNNLTKLIIPENCEFIGCVNNKLNKLIVPKGCIFIYCGNNNIHPIVVDLFKSEDPVKIQLANNLQR